MPRWSEKMARLRSRYISVLFVLLLLCASSLGVGL
jgi:hypothetical protein